MNQVKKISEKWPDLFPLDVWWRSKHGIPFGSKMHMEQSLVGMYMEWEEDQKIEELTKKIKESKDVHVYSFDSGIFFKKEGIYQEKMSEEEIVRQFDSIEDLSQFDDPEIKEE